MGRRKDLIELYRKDLIEKCRMEPDMALLEKVAIGCGPAIYDSDGQFVAASDPRELDDIKRNLLIRKLALPDTPELSAAIEAVIDVYGRQEPRKYRAVVYYMLVKHFGREIQYL